jgi:hypothetical protein
MKVKYYIQNNISKVNCDFDSLRIDKRGNLYAIVDNPQEKYEIKLNEKEYSVALQIYGDLKHIYE